MANFEVVLPKNRVNPGTLELRDGDTVVAGPFPVLGKADNQAAAQKGNPTRNPEREDGDTPLGEYGITEVVPTGGPAMPAHSYGPNGALRLNPVAGQALIAKRNGRTGLLIHGGDPRPSDGGLRPTHGCLRVSDPNMAVLAPLVRDLLARGEDVTVNVS